MIKSKSDLKNKYLKPKKKQREEVSHVEHQRVEESYSSLEKESNESYDADNLPVFVETEESRKIDDLEKKKAYEAFLGRPVTKENKQQSGTWKTMDASLGKRDLQKEGKKKASEDSSSDGESSSEDAPRKRHDSSESDIEIDSEERNKEKNARNQAFKDELIRALGIEPEKNKGGSPKDSDIEIESDADQNDAKIRDEVDPLKQVGCRVMQLEEAKMKEKELHKLAEQYKHAGTQLRDKEGNLLNIADLKESKENELKKLNERNVDSFDVVEAMEVRHGSVRREVTEKEGIVRKQESNH